jgi:predicted Zn finger-like uncharacterized protein
MKITCPECSSSFDIPLAMMPPGGRRVKCGSCGHIWVQQPVTETSGFGSYRALDGVDDIDPIPASVHPHDGQDEGDAESGPGLLANIQWPLVGRMVAGFVLAWVVVLAGIYGLNRAAILPGFMAPLAVAAGFAHPADMHGLEFQEVTAHVHNGSVVLAGKIFNGADKTQIIPMVEITPMAADGTAGAPKQVKPEQDSLKSQESVPFAAQLPGAAADTQMRLRFIP